MSTICHLPGFISWIIDSGEGAIFTRTTVDRKKMAPGTVNQVPVIARNTVTANKKHPGNQNNCSKKLVHLDFPDGLLDNKSGNSLRSHPDLHNEENLACNR